MSDPDPTPHVDGVTELWRSGEQTTALSAAFRAERKTMYGIARRILGDHAAADVAQEAFLKVWLHPDRFDPTRGTLGLYLRMTTRRIAIDHLRTTVARERRDNLPGDDQHAGSDPFQMLADRDTALRVSAALTRLPIAERELIVDAFYGHFTYSELAERRGIPLGTVKSRIRQGMQRLRSTLHSDAMQHQEA